MSDRPKRSPPPKSCEVEAAAAAREVAAAAREVEGASEGRAFSNTGGGAGVGGAHPLLLYARCCSYISALQAQNPSGDAEGRFLEELAAFVDRHPPSSSAPAAALAHAEEVTKKDPGKARRRARFADDEGQ